MPLKGLLLLKKQSQILKLQNNPFKKFHTSKYIATSSCTMLRNLAAFDFDHTIIDDNSDTKVMNLIDRSKIPKEIKRLHRSDGWTAFMQGIFKLLHDNNKAEQDITELIKRIPPVKGMCQFIKKLNEVLNYDVIIISDSNSFFIDLWLKEYKLDGNISKVFTNPAHFEDGLLVIKMYHLQDSCKLSTKNLCKGMILDEFLRMQSQEGVEYGKVVYCGDGLNDFCPILRLGTTDVACVREKYKCVDLVRKAQKGDYLDEEGVPYHIKPNVCIWNNAYEIMEFLEKCN